MGGAFDAIVAIVSNTIALGSLLVAYLSWRETQPTPPAVTIERDGVRVMLSDCTPETVAQVVTALGQAGDP
jgi:hypothetical protein